MSDEIKHWYRDLYGVGPCDNCDSEHVLTPHLAGGSLEPIEILGAVYNTAESGYGPPFMLLGYGSPESSRVVMLSIICVN